MFLLKVLQLGREVLSCDGDSTSYSVLFILTRQEEIYFVSHITCRTLTLQNLRLVPLLYIYNYHVHVTEIHLLNELTPLVFFYSRFHDRTI